MLKKLILAVLLASSLTAAFSSAQVSDPNCSCGPTLNLIAGGAASNGNPPLFGCLWELTFENIVAKGAPCSPPPDCEWLSPSVCTLTIGSVTWVQNVGSGSIVLAADTNVFLRAPCGVTSNIAYRCPSNPAGISVGIELACAGGCSGGTGQ